MLDDEERARRFEALVDADPDFIAIASVDGKVDFVNRAGRRLVGFDEDADLATTSILDFLTPEGLLASVEHEQPAVVRDGHWSGTSTLRDWRDDSGIPVAVSSFLLRDVTTDEPLAMATIQRDLRESLRAAEAVDAARAALVASEQRHEALLLHMSDLVMVVSAEGDLSYASPSAGRILGHPEDWYVGQNLLDHVHTADRPTAREWLVALTGDDRSEEQRSLLAFRLRAADGSHRRYEALASNLADDETVGGVLVVVRDVTEHHEAARAQRSETRLLELIASEAPIPEVLRALAVSVEEQLDDTLCTVLLAEGPAGDMIFRHGASPGMPAGYQAALDGRSIPDDPSPCGLSARSQSPVLVADLMADDRFSALRALAQACDVRSCWSFPVLSPRTGELLGTFALYTRAPGLPDDRIAGIIARTSWLVAITLDRQLLVAQLAHQALHDDLTGLANRPSLLQALSASLDAAAGAPDGPGPAVVLLDLDRLKVVNDSLGHHVGDELLVRIAERLPGALPPGATVARFGGDEFVVLVDGVAGPDAAAALADGLLAVVAEPVLLAGRLITPSASAGVVIAKPGQSAIDVLRDADIAMYRAKHSGGSGHRFFSDDMRQRAFDRLDLEQQVREGLADGQFRAFYQPVVDLAAGDALIGFEALIRWQHPTRGLLLPGAFMDLAEETGLVVELGDWMLRTAAATVGGWSSEVPWLRGTLAVNLASRQLAAPGLVPAVREAMARLGGWSLALELTESTLMEDTQATLGTLDRLVGLGATLSIDDFGTGFSSLSYLTRLPVTTLKIDRTFVHDLENPGALAVAATVLNLASSLDLTVVAEGIETPAQRETLLGLGCRLGQGFLMGRPLPEDAALAFLEAAAGGARRTG